MVPKQTKQKQKAGWLVIWWPSSQSNSIGFPPFPFHSTPLVQMRNGNCGSHADLRSSEDEESLGGSGGGLTINGNGNGETGGCCGSARTDESGGSAPSPAVGCQTLAGPATTEERTTASGEEAPQSTGPSSRPPLAAPLPMAIMAPNGGGGGNDTSAATAGTTTTAQFHGPVDITQQLWHSGGIGIGDGIQQMATDTAALGLTGMGAAAAAMHGKWVLVGEGEWGGEYCNDWGRPPPPFLWLVNTTS